MGFSHAGFYPVADGAAKRKEKEALSPRSGSYCRWTPFRSRAHRILNSLNANPVFARRQIYHNGVWFCSLSEAALGVILERLIPGFQVIEGLTFQVPMGAGRSVDFQINGVLIEYHQVRLAPKRGSFGDFRNWRQYARYARRAERLIHNKYRWQSFTKKMREKLAFNYYTRRKRVIESNPFYRKSELIVASSREEFYAKVILRFVPRNPPTLAEFLGLFWWWVNIIAKENGLPPLKKSFLARP